MGCLTTALTERIYLSVVDSERHCSRHWPCSRKTGNKNDSGSFGWHEHSDRTGNTSARSKQGRPPSARRPLVLLCRQETPRVGRNSIGGRDRAASCAACSLRGCRSSPRWRACRLLAEEPGSHLQPDGFDKPETVSSDETLSAGVAWRFWCLWLVGRIGGADIVGCGHASERRRRTEASR